MAEKRRRVPLEWCFFPCSSLNGESAGTPIACVASRNTVQKIPTLTPIWWHFSTVAKAKILETATAEEKQFWLWLVLHNNQINIWSKHIYTIGIWLIKWIVSLPLILALIFFLFSFLVLMIPNVFFFFPMINKR